MSTTATTNGEASSAFQAALAAAGYQNNSLNDVSRAFLAIANLIYNPTFVGALTGTSGSFTGPVTGTTLVGSAVSSSGPVTGTAIVGSSVNSSGAITGTALVGTSAAITGNIASSGGQVGYGTGAGGAVTQTTNRSTGVTLAKVCGLIQTDTTSLAAGASAEFPVTATGKVAITDVPVVAIRSGTTTNATKVNVSAVAADVFNITVTNGHASTAETGAIIINYAIVKGVVA